MHLRGHFVGFCRGAVKFRNLLVTGC